MIPPDIENVWAVGAPTHQRGRGDGQRAAVDGGQGAEGRAVGPEGPLLVLGHHVVPLEGQH